VAPEYVRTPSTVMREDVKHLKDRLVHVVEGPLLQSESRMLTARRCARA